MYVTIASRAMHLHMHGKRPDMSCQTLSMPNSISMELLNHIQTIIIKHACMHAAYNLALQFNHVCF